MWLGPEVVTSVTTIFLDEEDQRVWGVNLPWYWRCVRINSHTFRTQLDQVWGYKTEIRLVPGEREFLRVLDSATQEVLGGWNRSMSGDYYYFMLFVKIDKAVAKKWEQVPESRHTT